MGAFVAVDIWRWAETSNSERDPSTEIEIQDLMYEASVATRDNYDVDSANEWASPKNLSSRCQVPAVLDFTSMVRWRLRQLAPNRLSNERMECLRPDNPGFYCLNKSGV
jgi:hypothetical protein